MAVNTHRLTLIIAGLVSTATIAAAASMSQRNAATWPVVIALLLLTYVLGLGVGRLLFGRGK